MEEFFGNNAPKFCINYCRSQGKAVWCEKLIKYFTEICDMTLDAPSQGAH